MKLLHWLLLIWGVIGNAALAYDKNADTHSRLGQIMAPANAGRLLLLAFTDRTIGSLKATAAPNSYRQRGNYRSSSWSERVTDQIAEDYRIEKLAEWPMTGVGMHCAVYQLGQGVSSAEVIGQLAKDKRVEIVQNMHYYKTQAQSSRDPYAKLQTNLASMRIEKAHQRADGKGITVGIIDTGVDVEHPDLKGQVVENQNLVQDLSPTFNSDKHGTAIAGVIAAKSNNKDGIIGIAPNARLVALKACWPEKPDAMEAACNSFSLALAINAAMKTGVDVLNMSLAGPEDPLLTALLKKAIEDGMIVVAAGSGDPGGENNFPASMGNVLSVESFRQTEGVHQPAADTITAQGDQVLTTLPHGTYDFISGHSIAAAEVSGIVALLLELKREQLPSDIRNILFKSTINNAQGIAYGIDVSAALNSVCDHAGCGNEALSLNIHKLLPN
jgi:subtilisin family serine protease